MAALAPSVPVAVLGAGTMGAGIAQVAAAAGHPVLLYDEDETALPRAIERIAAALAHAVDKKRLAAADRDATVRRIKPCGSLDALAPARLAIEGKPCSVARLTTRAAGGLKPRADRTLEADVSRKATGGPSAISWLARRL